MIQYVSKFRLLRIVSSRVINVRLFGGYIEDAQLAMLGLEVYKEVYGNNKHPCKTFVVPKNDEIWPSILWGYPLGKGVEDNKLLEYDPRSS